MPSYSFGTGKGLREPVSPYRQANFFGAEMNSPSAAGWNDIPQLVGPATSFDLASITENHEVLVALLGLRSADAGTYNITYRWYRDRDGALLFTYTFSLGTLAGQWLYAYSYIGWFSWEISENGSYSVDVQVTGAGSYSNTIHFTVSGIPEVAAPPPPGPGFAASVVGAFNSVSAWFYEMYLEVSGWVWPFSWLNQPAYWLSVLFSDIAWGMSDLLARVDDIAGSVVNFLSWDSFWGLLLQYVPNLLPLRDWFYNWWGNVRGVVTSWWEWVQWEVRGWISAATEGLAQLRVDWVSFWSITWPSWLGRLDVLSGAWEYFTRVTLPGLPSWLDIGSWFDARLRELAPFWEGWQEVRTSVLNFLANPVDYIWERFTDWFLGPEE